MAITLNKTIARDADNTIEVTTPYSELNQKADNLVEDVVTHMETEIQSMETQFNSDVAASVAESAASAAAALVSENNASDSETAAETAKNLAVNAQIAAETAEDAAVVAKVASEAAADRAEAVIIPTEATYDADTIDSKIYSSAPYAQHGLIPNDGVNEIRPQDMFTEVDVADVSVDKKGYPVRFTDRVHDRLGEELVNVNSWVPSSGGIIEILNSIYKITGSAGDVFFGMKQELNTEIGKSYRYTVSISSDFSYSVTVGSSSGVVNDIINNNYTTQKNTVTIEFTATTTTTNVCVYGNEDNAIVYASNISVKELPQFALPKAPFATGATDELLPSGLTTTTNHSKADIVITGDTDTIYIALQDTTAGALLSDTTKFKPIPYVTKQCALLIEKTSVGAILNTVKPLVNMYGEESVETYEADIFGELGYSQKADRVWTDGSSEFILVGLKGYLNAGAYHPWFNAYGTSGHLRGDNGISIIEWYAPIGTTPSSKKSDVISTYDTFNTAKVAVPPNVNSATLTYNSSVYSRRSDSKFYDKTYINGQNGLVIYAVPNANKPTFKMLEEVKRNLVDGYIQNGTFTEQVTQTTTGTVATLEVSNGTLYKVGDYVQVYDMTNNTVHGRKRIVSIATNTLTLDSTIVKVAGSYLISGGKSPYLATQGNSTFTSLLGNPQHYPTSVKSLLTSGKAIGFCSADLVNDSGTTLIPDGVIDTFKVSKKGITFYNAIRSTDSDTNPSAPTWTSFTPTSSTVTNALTLTNEPIGNLVLAQYSSGNQSAVSIATPKSVLVVDRDIIASNSSDVNKYNGLVYAATGKIATGSSVEAKGVDDVVLDENSDIFTTPQHVSLTLDSDSIVASKALVTQTANATQVFTQEMVWDSVNSDWGDSNEFDQLTSGTAINLDGSTIQTKVLLKPSSIKLGE
jgi:hypothetical protein